MSFNSRKQSVGSISRSTSALEPFQTAFSVVLDLARFGNHLSYVTGNKPDQNSRGTDFVVPFSTFRAVSEQSLNRDLYCLALSQKPPTPHPTILQKVTDKLKIHRNSSKTIRKITSIISPC